MTTAAKATYFTAKGGSGRTENDLGALSKQYSSRDLPSHTKLKYRQDGQSSASDLKNKDFKRDAEEKERASRDKKNINIHGKPVAAVKDGPLSANKKDKMEPASFARLDADDPTINDDDDDEDDDDDNEDSDDEMEDDLELELNKIRKDREVERAKKDEERKEEEERVRIDNIIKGNPLLNMDNGPSEFRVKRRWDDDVVFKNCAREDDSKKPRHFINDTLRSEFHKKFMEKYIK